MNPDINALNAAYNNSPGIDDTDDIIFRKVRSSAPVDQSSGEVSTQGYIRLATVSIWTLILGLLLSGIGLGYQYGMAVIANHQANQDLKVKDAQLAQIREATNLCTTFGAGNATK